MPFYTSTPPGVIWQLGTSYQKDAVVLYTDNELYAANANIPTNTPFAVGTAGATWRLVSNTGTSTADNLILKTGHGFAVNDWLAITPAGYIKAQANNTSTAEVIGMVSQVVDANSFRIYGGGDYVTGLSGLTPGPYYLSPTVAGGMTNTEPSVDGQISKPVFLADSGTTGFIVDMRGAIIGNPFDPPIIAKAQLNLVTSEPALPSIGDVYIATTTGVSSVRGQAVIANNIYRWLGGPTWEVTAPAFGWLGYDQNLANIISFNGTTWVAGTSSASLTSPDTTTYINATNPQIDFVVNGIPVGSMSESGGVGKLTWPGILDPVAYLGTPQTLIQRDALVASSPSAKKGYLVYVVDTGVDEYQVWDGTAWKSVGNGGALRDWQSGESVVANDVRTINLANTTVLIRSNATRPTGVVFNLVESNQWTCIAQAAPGDYVPGEFPVPGLTISTQGSLWRLQTTGQTRPSFDATEQARWTRLTANLYTADGAITSNRVVDGASPVAGPGRTLTFNSMGATTINVADTAAGSSAQLQVNTNGSTLTQGNSVAMGSFVINNNNTFLDNENAVTGDRSEILVNSSTDGIRLDSSVGYKIGVAGTHLPANVTSETIKLLAVNTATGGLLLSPTAVASVPLWVANTAVVAGELRIRAMMSSFVLMRSASPRTTNATFDGAEALAWECVSQSQIGDWSGGDVTLMGVRVKIGSGIYQSTSARVTGATFDAVELPFWALESNRGDHSAWLAGEPLLPNEVRTRTYGAATVYMRNGTARIAGATFDLTESANWELVSQSKVPDWSASTIYLAGTQVLAIDSVWERIATGTSGATFNNAEQVNWRAISALDAVWQVTTNNVQTSAGEAWIVQTGHTVKMPASPVNGASIMFAPQVDWNALSATFSTVGLTTVAAGQVGILAGFDVVTAIYDATADNWAFKLGGAVQPNIAYATLAAIPAPNTVKVGTVITVVNDPTPANNGDYTAVGAAVGNDAVAWVR